MTSPPHPGITLDNLVTSRDLSIADLCRATRMSASKLSEIARGRRGITTITALRLAKALGTTPEYWLHQQIAYDIDVEYRKNKESLDKIKPLIT